MTLKMQEIISFPSFFEKVKTKPLPFKTSYHLTLLAKDIEKHYNFYQEKLQAILQEYGKKDENGNLVTTEDGQGIKLKEETRDEAYQKLLELRQLDVELPDITFITADFDGVELSPEETIIIMPFMQK